MYKMYKKSKFYIKKIKKDILKEQVVKYLFFCMLNMLEQYWVNVYKMYHK